MGKASNIGQILSRGGAVSATSAALAIGCGSSSDTASVGSGDAAVTDASGHAGSDGSFGAIIELNGEAEAPPAVICGGMMCMPPSGAMLPLTPCCLSSGGCGASVGGGVCVDTAPGAPDPSCPAISAIGMMLLGCCSATGVCGGDLSAAGLGCNSLSVFGVGEAGAPQPCGDAAGAPVPDAGTD